jgi:hypothetical protein
MTTIETIPGTKAFGTRIAQAQINFADHVAKVLGMDRDAGMKVFNVYHKAKVIKFDACNTTYNVKHGGLWDRGILLRALES